MKKTNYPILDSRLADDIVKELLARRAAYTPEWIPGSGDAALALMKVFSRYMELIIQRLNQAPFKNRLAFYNMLGLCPATAAPARAPIHFQLTSQAIDGHLPRRTRVGAQVADNPDPIVFETEGSIALASAMLTDIVSLDPLRDEYARHSIPNAEENESIQLFSNLKPTPHEFYIRHDVALALVGEALVELSFDFARTAERPLLSVWEYWNGQVWFPFEMVEKNDSTLAFTRNGKIQLVAQCGKAAKTTVHGIEGFWIRARLDERLPPDPGRILPEINTIQISTIIERPLEHIGLADESKCVGPISPDRAVADGQEVDLTREFKPLGHNPRVGTVFYFSNEEIMSKPGAEVSVCYHITKTREEEADIHANELGLDINSRLEGIRENLKAATLNSVATIREAAETINDLFASPPIDIGPVEEPGFSFRFNILTGTIYEKIRSVNAIVSPVVEAIQVHASPPSPDSTEYTHMYNAALNSAEQAFEWLSIVSDLTGTDTISLERDEESLSPAKLVWEYWDGAKWKSVSGSLPEPSSHFTVPEGVIRFSVPEDITVIDVNGIEAKWIRVRLDEGGFDSLRLTSWWDSEEEYLNFVPIVEARPPILDTFFLGYRYVSDPFLPEASWTHNDFQYIDRTLATRSTGFPFLPFSPVDDKTAALYLGFDRPFPNDLVSFYFDLMGNELERTPLCWELWDGKTWQEVAPQDETNQLQEAGIIAFVAPKVDPRREIAFIHASDRRIELGIRFRQLPVHKGDLISVRNKKTEEFVEISAIDEKLIHLKTPLAQQYRGGIVKRTGLPRFGTPGDWIRIRLPVLQTPSELTLKAIYSNVAWAKQTQTIESEVVGSGSDDHSQVFFLRHIPVMPGELVEVRELEGVRANVEWTALKEEVINNGGSDDDIRLIFDKRTDLVNEVWVRWHATPNVTFSGSEDRHYVIDRNAGRLMFVGKKVPPAGANNIRVRRYLSGGGLAGNLKQGQIDQLLSAAPFVEQIINLRDAEGGADAATLNTFALQAADSTRHWGRTISTSDYEALAREASPAVAQARALATRMPNGLPAAGSVTVVIVPNSLEPLPQPTRELCRQVQKYLLQRIPAGCITLEIAAPKYFQVGVQIIVTARSADKLTAVANRIEGRLKKFLHPARGGVDHQGWLFGQNIFLADVAAAVELTKDVDFASRIELLVDDVPQGTYVSVPSDSIVAAGSVYVEVKMNEYEKRVFH